MPSRGFVGVRKLHANLRTPISAAKAKLAQERRRARTPQAVAYVRERRDVVCNVAQGSGETRMTIRREAIRACVFDAYGTLFDVASACARCAPALGSKTQGLASLWREKQLQYTWLRTLQNRYADFWQVTAEALEYAMDTLGVQDANLREQLLQSYLRLSAFPEVPETLQVLKQSGYALVILSNGSPSMLAAAVEHAGVGGLLDMVISVDEVGVYKPHPKVYGRATERLGLTALQICFFSSNAWDAYAASAFGMQVVWCNRYGQRSERLPGAPDAQISDLSQVQTLLLGR